jgi:hypothetical protein
VTYLCNGRGYILGTQQTMECTKWDYIFESLDSEKKSNKTHYISPHKDCEGRYFMEIPKSNIKLPDNTNFISSDK